MAVVPAIFLPHKVTVEENAGSSGWGESFGPASPSLRCMVSHRLQLMRSDAGEDVQSTARLVVQPKDRDRFKLDARVTLPDKTSLRVLQVDDNSDGGLGAWQHVRVWLG